jgi:hypothetical protein
MSFIHGYLLAGLVLVGVPILLHLIMRQKPKQLAFPAFRFLRQKARINQRKIRLQHWLLLALRMLLIAALCFALAQPRLSADRVPFGGEQAVAAVFVFDTSPSMEYTVAGTTRLDEAKRRARDLLNDLSPSSQIAVLDTADDAVEDSDQWPDSAHARTQIESLHIRSANAPVNRQIERAYRLLQMRGEGPDAPPRFLFVFSDRTRESWDAGAAKRLQPVEGVNTVYVDVGVENPKDLSIDKLEIVPPVVAPGGKVTIHATVRATGDSPENEITCEFDPEPEKARLPEPESVKLAKGASQIISFERVAPAKPEGVKEAAVHVVVRLGTKDWTDALPSNNVRHATFLVRDKRKILTVVAALPPPNRRLIWEAAVNNAPGGFECDLKTVEDAQKLDAAELKKTYHAICLLQVAQVPPQWWHTLARFVENGGGLAIVPGGEEMLRKTDDMKPVFDEFNNNGLAEKVELLPARFRSLVTVAADQAGVPWTDFNRQHPITAPFAEWSRSTNPELLDPQTQPRAYRYWAVEPVKDKGIIIAAYADRETHPALLERQAGRGRVLLFTTQLANTRGDDQAERPWQNYWSDTKGAFGLPLVDLTCRYLAGESSAPELNYLCGQPVTVSMPPAPYTTPFTLQGPGLTPSENNVPVPDNSPSLPITHTLGPGHYFVLDGNRVPFAGFSLNVRPEEYNLERVPVPDIEAALGKDTVLTPGPSLDLRQLLKTRWAPPFELLPYLMMFLLLALTVESLIANFFYRRQPSVDATLAAAPAKEVAA